MSHKPVIRSTRGEGSMRNLVTAGQKARKTHLLEEAELDRTQLQELQASLEAHIAQELELKAEMEALKESEQRKYEEQVHLHVPWCTVMP